MRALGKLGVVYYDVCTPFDIVSLVGNKYFIYFVNEFSRMMWVPLTKARRWSASTFREFQSDDRKISRKMTQDPTEW